MFQSLICRALFPRVLRVLFSRIAAFREYSVFFEDHADGLYCIVRTWDEQDLQEICVHVEALGQKVPRAELSSLARVISCVMTSQLPLSIHDGSASLLRVLGDNRIDGRQFLVSKEFTVDLFLQCSREAHQHIFGMLEVTTMVDFLMLRMRGALQEPWMGDMLQLRQCVVAGKVSFAELRGVVKDLISIWESVRAFVRYTVPRHINSESDRVSFVLFS